MDPLLQFDHVHYAYSGGDGSSSSSSSIPAVRDVSLTIEEGEFVALVGANGSGKSTFARLAAALLLPETGSVRVMGLDTRSSQARAAVHARVGIVFQYPEDQIVGTTVEEDAAFGPESLGLPGSEIRARVEEVLKAVGLWEYRERPPHMLSAGQTQRLALAGVLAMRPRCILFDEASTMLDPAGRRDLLDTMQRLNREGLTVLFITHFMEEAALARRVVVFHQGHVALDAPPAEVFRDRERMARLGLDLPTVGRAADLLQLSLPQIPDGLLTLDQLEAVIPPYTGEPVGEAPQITVPAPGGTLIEVDRLGHMYLKGTPLAHRALRDASLQVFEGQAHGLIGRTGSGKSTLLQHLNGLLRPQEGRVRVGRFDLNDPNTDRRQVVRQVGLVFQNPEAQFFEHFVGDEIAFGPRQYALDEPLRDRVRWAMDLVGLDFEGFKDRPLFALSGGERRKVALASTLALKPAILLLDEPTAGLDPRSRRELLDKLGAMQAAGMGLVLSSHQMGDMAVLTHRLTVFERGDDVLRGPTHEIFAQGSVLRGYGMEPPVSVQVAEILRERGWPIPAEVITLDEISLFMQRLAGRAGEAA